MIRVHDRPTATPAQVAAIALLNARYPALDFTVGKEPNEVVAAVPLQHRVYCDVTRDGWLAEMDRCVEKFRAACVQGMQLTERAP